MIHSTRGNMGAGRQTGCHCRSNLSERKRTLNVVITGGAGFIGRRLAVALLEDGHRVLAIDNFITSDEHDLAPVRGEPGLEFEELDVRDPAVMESVQRFEPDQIYHLACPTGVHNLVPLAQEMIETSFLGTRFVLEAARKRSTPVLLASSAEVYGDPMVSPQPESYTGNVDTVGRRNGYEEGKRAAESLVGIYTQKSGVPGRIARIFNTYGPGMSMRDTRVVPAMVRRALSGEPLVVYGDGSQTRCHSYVDDTVAGLRRVMEDGEPGRPYNIGSTHQLSIRNLAAEILEVCGSESRLEFAPHQIEDHGQRLPDINRAREELGWEPATPLREGLTRTVEDLRARMSA